MNFWWTQGRTSYWAWLAALCACTVIAAVPAAAAPRADQECTAMTTHGFFGNTVSQTVSSHATSVSGFDVAMGFTQKWSHPLVARLVRIAAADRGLPMAAQTQTLTEVATFVKASAYTIKWVPFHLPRPLDLASSASLGSLAIQLVDLPPPDEKGRGVEAWLACGAAYPGGQVFATANVYVQGKAFPTPLQTAFDADAAFRLYI